MPMKFDQSFLFPFPLTSSLQIDKKRNGPKIWIYRTPNGESKGEATVTYDDPYTANSAIDWFNGKIHYTSLTRHT